MLHIQSLDLSGNQLISLPGVEDLLCVSVLVLDDNRLEDLPSVMAELQLLRVLSIRNNSIHTLSYKPNPSSNAQVRIMPP